MYSLDFILRLRAYGGRTNVRVNVPRTVYLIGVSSLLADISAESVTSILPLYLYSVLQLSMLQIGLLDGLYQGGAALVQLVSAYFADRLRNNRGVAFLGYGLSVVSKAGLIASCMSGFSALLAMASLVIDRVGKGIRVAPRDALIAAHACPTELGSAFGVHRALDAVGALAGPLVGAGILLLWPQNYGAIFSASICFGLCGLGVFATGVREGPTRAGRPANGRAGALPLATVLRKLRSNKPFLKLVFVSALLTMFTISDALVYLTLQRRSGLPLPLLPLMFTASALVFVVGAFPAGRLADRIGSVRVYLLGNAALALLYVAIALLPGAGLVLAVATFLVHGAYYSATDGVVNAAASELLDPEIRTSGLAVLGASTGSLRLASSAMYGLCWASHGQTFTVSIFAVGLAASTIVCFSVLLRGRRGGR